MSEFKTIETQEELDSIIKDRLDRNTKKITAEVTKQFEGYISPDDNINAAACMFPEQTWFIRGLTHSAWSDYLDEFTQTLLYHDGQATVETFAEYPRWLLYHEGNGAISEDNEKFMKDLMAVLY